jgi:hypothetical protein
MAEVTLSLEEYEALRSMAHDNSCINCSGEVTAVKVKKPKPKTSSYNKAYSKAFKKFEPKYKKKNGGWMKDGFKRTAAAARKSIK